MAKKKKNKSKGQQSAQLSPERFMREKARTLPIGKCYITPEWQESGISQIIVSRVRPSGNLAYGIFLVDTFCIGIKDAAYNANSTESDFDNLIKRYKDNLGLEEITYNEAHNIIYGAISFAEEGGIKPAKDFGIAQYILEEDTDEIPLIDYEFGKDGYHFLVINSDRREMPYLHQLRKTLGSNFKYIIEDEEMDFEEYDEDQNPIDFSNITEKDIERAIRNMERTSAENSRHPEEVYSYEYPDYPKSLTVKNQFIADELLSTNNLSELPKEIIEKILALPHDEAVEDISNIIFYEIGRTCHAINDDIIGDVENSALFHALFLLTQLRSEKGLDAVLEILRQNGEFADYHFGDLAPEVIHPALYACGMNNLPAIEALINQPGLYYYVKGQVFDALTMIVMLHPERRSEVIEVFRRTLNSMVTRLPNQYACDGHLAGFLMGNLMDMEAKELIPEIKAVFETGCVNKTIVGDLNAVLNEIQNGSKLKDRDKYKFPDIYEQYARLKSFG